MVRVTRAPKGSAVFEVVSEEQYSGVVLDRMLAKGSNIASGLVQYELDGVPSKLTYGPKDLQVRLHHALPIPILHTLPAPQSLIICSYRGFAQCNWMSHARHKALSCWLQVADQSALQCMRG